VATTSLEAARVALNALAETGIGWALLHGSADLAPDKFRNSDLDIVVDRPPHLLLSALRMSLERGGLSPIVLSRYDAGKTSFLFCADEDGSEGVQLDLLYDQKGWGVLRLPSMPLLDEVEKRGPLGVASVPEDVELIYLWRKALRKRQAAKVDTLRQLASQRDAGALLRTSHRLTGTDNDARGLLSDEPIAFPRRSSVNMALQLPRLVERVRTPRGFWLHIPGDHPQLASGLRTRFERILLHARIFELSSSTQSALAQYARKGFLMHRRAALVVTWGSSARLPVEPDLIATGHDGLPGAARRLVSAMAEQLETLET